MKKADLAEIVREKTGCTKATALETVGALFQSLVADTAAGNSTTLVGFGSLKAVKKPARKGRNPKTGEQIKTPAKKVVVFKAGKQFKEAVNKKRRKK